MCVAFQRCCRRDPPNWLKGRRKHQQPSCENAESSRALRAMRSPLPALPKVAPYLAGAPRDATAPSERSGASDRVSSYDPEPGWLPPRSTGVANER